VGSPLAFRPAVKSEAKLRLALSGPSGSGKTFTALTVGSRLGKRVAVIDTEHGSASKYADLWPFDVLELTPPYSPDRYREAMAAAAGYDVLIVDSLSHAWAGEGGLLERVDEIAKRSKSASSFAAWREGTPEQHRLIGALLAAPMHLIATMRSKQEYVVDRDGEGRTRVRKLGLAPVQRDGVEYEFDLFAEMDLENTLTVQKSRCPALQGRVIRRPGAEVAAELQAWLVGAPAVTPAPTPEPKPAPRERDVRWPQDFAQPAAESAPQAEGPTGPQLERIADLLLFSESQPKAKRVTDGLRRGLADAAAGRLSKGAAGALIGRAKASLEPLGWRPEPEVPPAAEEPPEPGSRG